MKTTKKQVHERSRSQSNNNNNHQKEEEEEKEIEKRRQGEKERIKKASTLNEQPPPGVQRCYSKSAIVQWNIGGMRNKKKEIIHLIDTYDANIVALQETMLSTDYLIKIPKYNVIAKEGPYNTRQHGGVAMYIHGDTPYQEITHTTACNGVVWVI